MKYKSLSMALLLNCSSAIMINREKYMGYDVSDGTAEILKETREVISNEATRYNAG